MSIASRITAMEEHIANAYDGLEDLGIDLTNVDKNIDNISAKLEQVYSEYPKITPVTDVTSASLENTKKGRMQIDLKGNTSQQSYEGYNLWNNGTSTTTQNSVKTQCNNGLMIMNGTTSVDIGDNIYGQVQSSGTNAKFITHLQAGTYKLFIRKVSGSLSYESGSSAFYIRNTSNTILGQGAWDKNTQQRNIPITLEEESDIYCQWFVNKSGWNFDNYVLSCTLVSGTTERDFEPYVRRNSKSKSKFSSISSYSKW